MKTTVLLLLAFVSIGFVSCTKHDSASDLKTQTEQRLNGKWAVEKRTYQEYAPIDALKISETHPGGTDDFFDFLQEGILVSKAGTTTIEKAPFEVINPFQIKIKDQCWFIETLTSTNLIIYLDLNDASTNTRYFTKIYLRR